MLQLDGEPWATGMAELLLGRDLGSRGTVYVDCEIERIPTRAFLDTGNELSIVGGELAKLIEPSLGSPLTPNQTLKTWRGDFVGNVYRLETTLIATEGDSLDFQATVLLCEAWEGPVVLGFYDALDRLRVAFEPDLGIGFPRLHLGLP